MTQYTDRVKYVQKGLANPEKPANFARKRVRPAPAELPQARNGARVGGRSGAIPVSFLALCFFPTLCFFCYILNFGLTYLIKNHRK